MYGCLYYSVGSGASWASTHSGGENVGRVKFKMGDEVARKEHRGTWPESGDSFKRIYLGDDPHVEGVIVVLKHTRFTGEKELMFYNRDEFLPVRLL